MYELSVRSEFSSAHNLRGYRGKCESLHGHNWQVEVVVCSGTLDATGMAVDFRKLKSALKKITQQLDHCYLNKLSFFKKTNPTSEHVAEFIFNKMQPLVNKGQVRLKCVSIWENERSKATYYA